MNSPYSHPRFRRLKRKSRVRYGLAVVAHVPEYIAWRFSKLIPEDIGLQLRKRFGFLAVPFHNVAGFVQLWILTRPWKRILLALPLIGTLIWMQSTLFLARNLTDEELYRDYRGGLLQSVGRQEYEFGDFLTGKLVGNALYKDDKELLFAAMISSHETGNIPRRNLLLSRLTQELNYSRAHIWAANRSSFGSDTSERNIPKAIQHMVAALEDSENPEPIYIQLAYLYYQTGRSEKAIQMLQELKEPTPRARILLAQIFLASGNRESAVATIRDLLADLDLENPERNQFYEERIDANILLINLGASSDEVSNSLVDLVKKLERLLLIDSEDESVRSLIASAYSGLARDALRSTTKAGRLSSLGYFEKAVQTGVMPRGFGSSIYSASNLDSSGGLSDLEMRAALVEGVGIPMAHIFLGLDAWKKGLTDNTVFHFRLAYQHEPEALKAVELLAIHVGRIDERGTLNPFRLSLDSQPLWKRALGLLDIVADINPESYEQCLLSKCVIMSNRQRWAELVLLVEPYLEKATSKNHTTFLNLLISGYRELGDNAKFDKYMKILQAKDPQRAE